MGCGEVMRDKKGKVKHRSDRNVSEARDSNTERHPNFMVVPILTWHMKTSDVGARVIISMGAGAGVVGSAWARLGAMVGDDDRVLSGGGIPSSSAVSNNMTWSTA
jgi:hypothetical protein